MIRHLGVLLHQRRLQDACACHASLVWVLHWHLALRLGQAQVGQTSWHWQLGMLKAQEVGGAMSESQICQAG